MKGNRLLALLAVCAAAWMPWRCWAAADSEVVRVCGQNLQNYYWNYDQTERTSTNYLWVSNYQDDAGRAAKTQRIVSALLAINADIYAFNEVEATDIILRQLADSLTKYSDYSFKAVSDGISYTPDAYDNHLKSGFIYRTDKVRPYGSNYAAATAIYYRDVMRIQAFEALTSGERFTLSMNHFKAGGEESESTRLVNASQLISALKTKAMDEDILILGDLNCETDAESVQKIVNEGFEEMLLKYNSGVYTHCYNGGMHLDHVLANATMARQVTRAWVEHVCTTCYEDNDSRTYSDHDPYVVMLRLGDGGDGGCEDIDYRESFASTMGQFTTVDVTGGNAWVIDNTYSCATMNGYRTGENEDWLISPAFDLQGKNAAALQFSHCVGYGTTADNWPSHLKLLISDSYDGVLADAEWQELPISSYGSRNWDWQTVTAEVPARYLGQPRVNVAFRYTTQSDGDTPQWEVKNFLFWAVCGETDGIAEPLARPCSAVRKVVEDGRLFILMPDGRRYTLSGVAVR